MENFVDKPHSIVWLSIGLAFGIFLELRFTSKIFPGPAD